MKDSDKILKLATTLFGLISLIGLIVGFFFFETLRPKMVRFEPVPANIEYLINYVGIGLLSIAIFHLFSFFRLFVYLKNINKISFFPISLLIGNVLSFLFVFGNLALLNDIGRQYKYRLLQPEWTVLYMLMAFQFIFISIMILANIFKLEKKSEVKYIAKDINTL